MVIGGCQQEGRYGVGGLASGPRRRHAPRCGSSRGSLLAAAASASHVALQPPRFAQRTFRAYVPGLLMFIVFASSDWAGSMIVSNPLQFFEVWPPQLGH